MRAMKKWVMSEGDLKGEVLRYNKRAWVVGFQENLISRKIRLDEGMS